MVEVEEEVVVVVAEDVEEVSASRRSRCGRRVGKSTYEAFFVKAPSALRGKSFLRASSDSSIEGS